MGPTAAGKTELALRWAQEFPIEIVSVDSAMVYRGLDIGAGKPSAEELRQTPHHLVDIRDPADAYSAGQFVRDAWACIADIRARGKQPLLVGGTMLYFRALMLGLADMPPASPAVRAELDAQAAREGWPALHALLADVDPTAAARILPNDAQRIQRALEVHRLTGRTLTELHARQAPAPQSRFLPLAWAPADRATLYERIAARFAKMMELGLLDEVRRLFERKDLSPELPALRSVGYRQLLAHLAGECGLEQAIERGVIATRHLARRQLIWLRGAPNLTWFDSLDLAAEAHIKRLVSEVWR